MGGIYNQLSLTISKVQKAALVSTFVVSMAACNASEIKPKISSNSQEKQQDKSYLIDSDRSGVALETNNLSPFLAGILARNNQEHGNSAAFFARALESDPESLFLKKNAFIGYFNAGDFTKAAKLGSQLAKSSDNEMLHILNVTDAIKMKDGNLALERLKSAPVKGYAFVVYPILKAWAASINGDKELAYASLDKMTKNPSLKLIALEYMAYVADYMKDGEKAEQIYKLLLEDKTSGSMQAVVAYASFLARYNRKDEVRPMILQALKRFPNNRYIVANGSRYLRGDKRMLSFIHPLGGSGNVFELLARDLSRYEDKTMALAFYNLAIFATGPNNDLVVQQAELLMQNKDFHMAARKYAEIPAESRYFGLANFGRIRALLAAGDETEALKLMNAALLAKPNNISVLTQLADYYRGKNDFKQAVVYYDRLLATITKPKPNDWYLYFSRGVCFEQLKDWEKAEKDLMFALKLSPEQSDVLNYLGYSWVDRGMNIAKARTMIEKAAKLNPENGYITDSLGWVYYLTGDYKKAVKTLEKAVLIVTGDATLHDHLGDAYWKVGRKIEARFQWRHALKSDPESDLRDKLKTKLSIGLM